MSITQYNGGSVVAMKGRDCVALASDMRFGVQALTLSTQFQRTFKMTDRLIYGLAGLGTDVQTLSQVLRFRSNMYRLREEREIEPKKFIHMVSSTLYEKRFGPYFVEPVVAGIDKDGRPHVWSTDLIGCINFPSDFAVAGTASESLYGMCESLYREDMNEEQLFEAVSQAFMNAVDRDCLSGNGVVVHLMTADKITTRTLKARQD